MLVELVRNEQGKVIGWTMKGESPEEIDKLGYIRDLTFWGFDSTSIVYAGRSGGDDATNNPGTLKWQQRRYEHPEEYQDLPTDNNQDIIQN